MHALINLFGLVLFFACCSAALLLTNTILDGNSRNSAIMRQLESTGWDFSKLTQFNDTIRWLSSFDEYLGTADN